MENVSDDVPILKKCDLDFKGSQSQPGIYTQHELLVPTKLMESKGVGDLVLLWRQDVQKYVSNRLKQNSEADGIFFLQCR